MKYIFETDPDGSYGYFNRLSAEAAAAATPDGRDRLLLAHGARWALAPDGEEHPLFRAVTGIEVGGKRLVLFEHDRPVPELRWAGRTWRRASASGHPRAGARRPLRSARATSRSPAAATRIRRTPRRRRGCVSRRAYADGAETVVEADAPGLIVFARTYFPAWKARVDGAPAPVQVANARDLAVAVPAGRHVVEIAWDRSPFRVGVALQAAGLVVALAAAAWSRAAAPAGVSPELLNSRPRGQS